MGATTVLLSSLFLWGVPFGSAQTVPCGSCSTSSALPCTLPCTSGGRTAVWLSLRRPTPFQEQDWFTCQCQSRSRGFSPAYTFRNTDVQDINVSSDGGYRSGTARKFVSKNEDALVGVSCPGDSGLYCDIRGWSEVAWPSNGLISIWGGLECQLTDDSEMRSYLSGSRLDYAAGTGTENLLPVQVRRAQSSGQTWIYRAASQEGYSAHFADFDIDPAATSYYSGSCSIDCGRKVGDYNAEKGECFPTPNPTPTPAPPPPGNIGNCIASDCPSGRCNSNYGGICVPVSGTVDLCKTIKCDVGEVCRDGICKSLTDYQPPVGDLIPDGQKPPKTGGGGSGGSSGGSSRTPTSTTTTDSPGRRCFPAGTLVSMDDGAEKHIEEIKTGDRVLSLTQNDSFDAAEVMYVPHLPNIELTSFLELDCKTDSGDLYSLLVTEGHFVFWTSKEQQDSRHMKAVPSQEVVVGDSLWRVVTDGASTRETCHVTSIREVNREGIYTAFTTSGMLVVDGFIASSYAEASGSTAGWVDYDHTLAHRVCSTIFGWAYTFGLSDWKPFRWWTDYVLGPLFA